MEDQARCRTSILPEINVYRTIARGLFVSDMAVDMNNDAYSPMTECNTIVVNSGRSGMDLSSVSHGPIDRSIWCCLE